MTKRQVITDVAQMPLVMTLADIATVLSCSSRTVKRLKHAGELPHPIVMDNKTQPRYSRDAIASWISGGTSRRGRR